MSKIITIEDVRSYVENNTNCKLLSTVYTGATDKMRFLCPCGKEFETDWHHLKTQNKCICNDCAEEIRRRKRRRHTVEELKERVESFGGKYVSGIYERRKSPIRIIGSCGHEFTTNAETILRDCFSCLCIDCARQLGRDYFRFSFDEVKKKCDDLGLELLSTEYKNARSPLLFRCSCGREYITTWENVKCDGKVRCDYCTHKVSSGELAVETWLQDNNVVYEKQKTFDDLVGLAGKKYRYDFYLPEYNLCVEYDGQQHFRTVNFSGSMSEEKLIVNLLDTYDHDCLKNQYCEDNGIDLLRISYKDKDRIPEILSSKLIPRYAGELKSS